MNRRDFLKALALSGIGTAGLSLPVALARQNTQKFFIPPTVHHLTENSASLYFRLGQLTTTGQLVVSQNGEIVQQIPLATDLLRQQIKIENLEPATTYTYQLLDNGAVPPTLNNESWEPLSFRTPPYGWPLRIAALGDSGFGDDVTYRMGAAMAAHNPHLFFHLGDVVYWMHEHNNDHFLNWYLKYFKPFNDMLRTIPHYATIGNHEYDSAAILDGWISYLWMFPPFDEQQYENQRHWYSFYYNDIQFICLNSQLFYNSYAMRDIQNDWLDEQLKKDARYRVVFFHVAPYNSGNVHQWDGMVIGEHWAERFEQNKVALVLSGHAHLYERLKQNGVHYIVAGAGCHSLYGEGQRVPQSQMLYLDNCYPILDLHEDRIELRTYTPDGDIIDEATLELPE